MGDKLAAARAYDSLQYTVKFSYDSDNDNFMPTKLVQLSLSRSVRSLELTKELMWTFDVDDVM